MARDYGVEYTLWPADVLRETLATERYLGGMHDPEPFHMDPLAYCNALAEDAEAAGAVHIDRHRIRGLDAIGGARLRDRDQPGKVDSLVLEAAGLPLRGQ